LDLFAKFGHFLECGIFFISTDRKLFFDSVERKMKLVTYVHIGTNSITVHRGDSQIANIHTSIKSGKIGQLMKMLGVAASVGLLLGASAKWKSKRMLVLTLLGVIMTLMGFLAFNNSVFRVKYRYDDTWQESADIVSSVINRSGFKVRKYSPHQADYIVKFTENDHFEVRNSNLDVEFSTTEPSYQLSVSDETYLGSTLKILQTAILRIEYEDRLMQHKDDIVILSVVMSYLKNKMRFANITGYLHLLGIAVPVIFIVQQWRTIEENVKKQNTDKIKSLLQK
jgi:hypothetical protein